MISVMWRPSERGGARAAIMNCAAAEFAAHSHLPKAPAESGLALLGQARTEGKDLRRRDDCHRHAVFVHGGARSSTFAFGNVVKLFLTLGIRAGIMPGAYRRGPSAWRPPCISSPVMR